MKSTKPVILALIGLTLSLSLLGWMSPDAQDPGQQAFIWQGQAINITPTLKTVACSQGYNSIGRKTIAVHNATPGSLVTITAELRDTQTSGNFTSGYLAVNGLAAGSYGNDTALPSEAGGAFCNFSATAAVTGIITVTLRRE